MARSRGARVRNLKGETQTVFVRPATSRQELEEAYRLVYHSYLQRGYVAEDPARIRYTLFNMFPGTATFIGAANHDVVSTVTLIPDSPAGLPMDDIYRDELQPLRDQGRRITEVTMLADRRCDFERTIDMLLRLMKLVFDYATLVLKATDMCITINPRHEKFYRRFLLFEALGEMKTYPTVQDNPALLERLDLVRVREECEGRQHLIDQFFEDRTPLDEFDKRYRLSDDDVRYFCIELLPLLESASPEAMAHLREARPSCPWDEWLGRAAG